MTNERPSASPLWLLLFLAIVCVFLFQHFYTWSDGAHAAKEERSLPEGRAVFLTFEETSFGTKKRGFDPLFTSLESYRYDKKEQLVWLKPVESGSSVREGGTRPTQLPQSGTQVMAIYDKGFDSFQKKEDVLPVSAFPYRYLQNEALFFEIRSIDKDGNVYLTFRGKRLKLEPHRFYPDVWFEGLRMKTMIIKNHGVFRHDQFKEHEEPGAK